MSRSCGKRHKNALKSSSLPPPVRRSWRPWRLPPLGTVWPRSTRVSPAPSRPVLMSQRVPSVPPSPGWLCWTRPGAGPSRPLPAAAVPLPVLPAWGSMAGVQECLHQLHRCLQLGDAASAALHGYSLLRSLGETCLTSLASGVQGAPSGPARPGRGGRGQGQGGLRGSERGLGGCSLAGDFKTAAARLEEGSSVVGGNIPDRWSRGKGGGCVCVCPRPALRSTRHLRAAGLT